MSMEHEYTANKKKRNIPTSKGDAHYSLLSHYRDLLHCSFDGLREKGGVNVHL